MKLILITLGIILVFVLINLYNQRETFKSLERDLEKVWWRKISKEKYVNKCYHFVADRFGVIRHCYLKYPWRNFFYRNIWEQKGKGLPCHLYALLFNRCLSKRFKKEGVKLVITTNFYKRMFLHFYSQVKLKGRWIDVDVWGKKRGIPFGKNIRNSNII